MSTYVPPGLAGLVLAGLLAAILSTVAAGLSASSSMVSYDFVLRFAPALPDQARVRLGRALMAGVLLLCAVLAPGIQQFKGVFGYLVQLWSLLAPPVFVCVVAGMFTRRASARGAAATLVIGTVLGGVAFWMLSSPDRVAQLPRYLRSSLNCGFVITLGCGAVMALFSTGKETHARAGEISQVRATAAPMIAGERRIYRTALTVLVVVWLAVAVVFSPWGLARPR